MDYDIESKAIATPQEGKSGSNLTGRSIDPKKVLKLNQKDIHGEYITKQNIRNML